jgi:hypothetical protein
VLFQTDNSGFDVIGDVHGCYESLVVLLDRLGYKDINGVYKHPTRQAIFLGDLIDRGSHIRETLTLVCAMEQAGSAKVILGNHEFNAIRYKQELDDFIVNDVELPSSRLFRLMKETLLQLKEYPDDWFKFTKWFTTLPLFLDSDGFRAVHACWDSRLINEYRKKYNTTHLSQEFIEASKEVTSLEYQIVDRLTRGTSLALPEGVNVESEDGFIRRFFRTKFWADSPKTYGDIVFQPDPLPYDLVDHPIKKDEKSNLVQYSPDDPPVFFGHYWLKGRPKPLLSNVACLDYSAVNFGRLTAYRFSGESCLVEKNFLWVFVEPIDDKINE